MMRPSNSTPDVLVDMTPLDTPSRFRGIGRYVAGLARGLLCLGQGPEAWGGLRIAGLVRPWGRTAGAVDGGLGYLGDPLLQPSGWTYRKYLLVRRVGMGTLARRTGARLLHLTDPKGTPLDPRVPRVVTCHDLIPLVLHRDYLGRSPGARTLQYLRDLVRYRTARRVIAISEATRNDLVEFLGLDPSRIDVIHHGVDHDRFRATAGPGEVARLAALGVTPPFLLYVGAGDRRKNLPLLVEAFALARVPADVRLVLAGRLSDRQAAELRTRASRLGVQTRVQLLGYVPEELIPVLYRACLANVFPSRYEGFGLPILEGMACGAPTLSSRVSSLVEVAGEAALPFAVDDVDSLAGAIHRIVHDAGLRDTLRARGLAWARTFTWERCARQTLATYASCLEE